MQSNLFKGCQRGLSLVELCTAVAVASILAGTALPSFKDSFRKRVFDGTAAQLATDLQFARSEAIARNQGVRVSFHAMPDASCMVIHTGATSDCGCSDAGVAQCRAGAVLIKSSYFAATNGVGVTASVPSMRFDSTLGTVAPAGTVKVARADGPSVHHVVNIMGRVRTCSPGASALGYKSC